MMGKSPLMKKLVGKQGNLPPALKAEIKASPGKMVSPLKEDKPFIKEGSLGADVRDTFNEYSAKLKSFRKANLAKTDAYLKKEGIDRGGETQKNKTEGSGAATANQNAGQTFQDLQKKVAGMSQAQKDSIKKAQDKMSGKKKTTPPKVSVAELKRRKSIQPPPSVQAKGKGTIKPPETIKKVDTSPKKSEFGKKAINRGSSFTDEYGNTFDRSVKGRKKDDGSVSKTVSNKTNDVTTREKDVTKGPKVKGKRRAKTVTKTKFDSSGKVRKVVEKTRGQKRKNLTDPEIKKKTAELKKRREERDNSPTKMKTKTPSKMMKKSPSKMMKKKSVKKADLKALQSFSKSSKSKYNSAVANKSKQKYPSPSTSKPSKSSFVSKLESKGTIKSSKNLTAAEKKKLASMKTGPAKMMKKKK